MEAGISICSTRNSHDKRVRMMLLGTAELARTGKDSVDEEAVERKMDADAASAGANAGYNASTPFVDEGYDDDAADEVYAVDADAEEDTVE